MFPFRRRASRVPWLVTPLLVLGCALGRQSAHADDGSWSELWVGRTVAHSEVPAPGRATVLVCVRPLGEPAGFVRNALVEVGPTGTVSRAECAPLLVPVGRQWARIRGIPFETVERHVVVRSNYVDTLHVSLARASTPSRAACREAARRGPGCL